jgi:NADH dehydrogenase
MGEDAVHAAASPDFHVTSFRPSVIFGPQDSFINRFAGLLRLSPFVFPLACPEAKFQPVYVGDVVRSFVQSLANAKTHGQRYDLCGPRVYTLRELVEYVGGLIGVKRRIIGLGKWMSKLQAATLELVPGKPFSLDNYRSLQVDSICSKGFPEIFGFTPTVLEDIVPAYINQPLRSQLYSERRRLPG